MSNNCVKAKVCIICWSTFFVLKSSPISSRNEPTIRVLFFIPTGRLSFLLCGQFFKVSGDRWARTSNQPPSRLFDRGKQIGPLKLFDWKWTVDRVSNSNYVRGGSARSWTCRFKKKEGRTILIIFTRSNSTCMRKGQFIDDYWSFSLSATLHFGGKYLKIHHKCTGVALLENKGVS